MFFEFDIEIVTLLCFLGQSKEQEKKPQQDNDPTELNQFIESPNTKGK